MTDQDIEDLITDAISDSLFGSPIGERPADCLPFFRDAAVAARC